VVVEPVTQSGDPAPATIWVPPGRWINYFTNKAYQGPSVHTLSVPLDQMPVLVRAGAIIPTQPYVNSTTPAPSGKLMLTAYPGAHGSFKLYDDQGVGFGYQGFSYTWTTITHAERKGRSSLAIGRAIGKFPGALKRRSWQVRLVGIRRPKKITVDGRKERRSHWSYDGATHTLTLTTGPLPTNRAHTIIAT